MTSANGDNPNRATPVGASVLIAGAGLAGLLCALECYRNGFDVTILEREPSSSPWGDLVNIGPSAKRIIEKNWPEWLKEWEKLEWHAEITYYTHDGDYIVGGFEFPKNTGHIFLRPELHEMMITEVKRAGIDIQFNTKVVGYFETEDKGGVKLENGDIMTADIVIAADGVHSRSWTAICPNRSSAQPSGYSAYRTCFPAEVALADPLVKARWGPGIEAGKQTFQFYMARDCHALVLFGKGKVSWTVIHQESQDTSEESWNAKLDADSAIAELQKVAQDWHPAFLALVKTTPPGAVTDFRLMWRDPQPIATSPLGRIAQIGDACHTFLPTSANGAVQAMEDAASIATCLGLGGKKRLTLSTRVHNLLRFERVSTIQLMGFVNRERLHKADPAALKKDPSLIRRGPGEWIGRHDVIQYALDNYEAAASHIVNGTPFVNTNLLDNYTYVPWNIEQFNADVKSGNWKVDMAFFKGGDIDMD